MGSSLCRNEAGCPYRWRGGVLRPQSTVVNRFGMRLGTADQMVMVRDGPWELQRKGLDDGRCVLLREWRRGPGRGRDGSRDGSWEGREELRIWGEGEPVPGYAFRSPPPPMEDVSAFARYEQEYLVGIPLRLREGLVGNGRARENGLRRGRPDERGGPYRGWSDRRT
jgi:hypothetical protein